MYDWIGKFTKNGFRARLIVGVMNRLPRRPALFLCRMSGWMIYLFAASARKRVKRNMSDLLPGQSKRTIHHWCRDYFCNLAVTLYEILIDSRRLDPMADTRFQVIGESFLQAALRQGRGVVLYGPHIGNFFLYYWHLSGRYSCLTVATAGSEELRPLYRLFERLGCRGLDYDSTAPLELMRRLRGHLAENGVVLLLGDFWRPTFPEAEFFGRMSRSPAGAAVLGLEWHVPIVPFYGYRIDGCRHRLIFGPPIRLYEEFDPSQRREAANALNRTLERAIVRVPEQWFYWFQVDERWESVCPQKENPIENKGTDGSLTVA